MTSHEINPNIRNIAIIAHVDHGKTTLVDGLFRQSGLFREGQVVDERIMDRGDIEKERGITISAKNCSITWKGVKINILDTPGHADFGGEVERALSMVDGVILLVDASEGPLPQTRFVLKKALEAGLSLITVINKIDRADARPAEVLDEIFSLLIDLDAREDQLEFPLFYAIGRDGIAQPTLEEKGENLFPLLDAILEHLPPPIFKPESPFQMLVSDLDYSDYLGRLAIGKVVNGRVQGNQELVCLGEQGRVSSLKVSKIQTYQGLSFAEASSAEPGDIIILAGVENVHIGDTICTKESPVPLKRLTVDEPTVAMKFYRNTGPLAGKESKFVQSSKLWERLQKEALRNVAIQVSMSEDKESFEVRGRGEFQMAIILETLRREGYELCVGRPRVLMKKEDGKTLEPIEHVFVDCEEQYVGVVTEKLSIRKGRIITMVNHGSGRARLEFSVPSRSLIGYRDEFLTDTRGTGLLNSYLMGYEPYRGDFPTRVNGSLVSDRSGNAVPYAIFNLEPRGRMFVLPGDQVYEGMIIGEHNRPGDLEVNPCREKKLTNIRAAGRDENVVLTPITPLTLESALNFLSDDEILEVTPKSLRLRKMILNISDRKIAAKRGQVG
jgi:GTP-binding protein